MLTRSFTTVGIDVSKSKLDVAVLTDKKAATQTFQNETQSIEKLIQWLRSLQVNAKTPIVIESTGSLHWLICLTLTEQGFTVHLINPLITKKYQKASIRDAKTDRIDALRLAEIAHLESDLPTFFDTRELLSAKRYQSLLAKLEKVKQQLQKAYKDALEASQNIGLTLELDCIEVCLKQIEEAIKILKKMITQNASPLAQKISEVQGVSLFQATVLCTAVEGRIFQKRDQMVAFFGLDIRQRQSGQWRGKETLSKRGNPFYRHVLFQLGWSLQRNNAEYHSYYQRLFKEQNKHYYTAILATARKFLRYFFFQYQLSL